MKKLVIILIVCSLDLFGQNSYRIEGMIHGISSGKCILAYNYYSSQLYSKDTAEVDKNGRFVFQKKAN